MGDNIRDYHAILFSILSPLIDLQEKGGFKWEFEIGGKLCEARCKVPVQFIIGDCKSQDMLCGRYGSHNCHSICRDCDCTFQESDDPNVICTPLKSSHINDLIDNDNTDALQKLSFHTHDNAFRKVCFGGDEYGINGATPPELLHEFRQGIFDTCLQGFYEICNLKTLEWIDSVCQKISIYAVHQSDRKFPRTSFPKGITSLAKITADEKIGVLLILFLCLYTRSGMDKFSHPTFANYRKLFHDLLVLHAFLFLEEHNTLLFDQVNANIRKCMKTIKDVVNRQEGNGFRFPKFHQTLHALTNICRYGSMRNFDGGPGECRGKTNTKQPARLTQKRAHTVTRQSGERLMEGLALDACLRHMIECGNISSRNNNECDDDECVTSYGGNKYIISFNELKDGNYRTHVQWLGKTKVRRGWCSQSMLLFIINDVIPSLKSDYITCYTEYKRFGIIFRAHPSYRSSQEWYDWAYVQFYNEEKGGKSIHPSKICCFLVDGCDSKNSKNLMMIIQCSETMKSDTKVDSLFPIVERRILDDQYYLVDAACIDQACYAIPDIGCESEVTGVVIVHPMDTWADEFNN